MAKNGFRLNFVLSSEFGLYSQIVKIDENVSKDDPHSITGGDETQGFALNYRLSTGLERERGYKVRPYTWLTQIQSWSPYTTTITPHPHPRPELFKG